MSPTLIYKLLTKRKDFSNRKNISRISKEILLKSLINLLFTVGELIQQWKKLKEEKLQGSMKDLLKHKKI